MMPNSPDISVVLSVYNGADHLRESVDSILSQEGVLLELIVVDDGSTDRSGAMLDEYARNDTRVRVINQENRGLTRALIRGCAAARGEFIARHDAGDISTPDRLTKQLEMIRSHGNAALVSCGTRFIGPAGEFLYTVTQEPADATNRLLTLDPSQIRGPSHHGSTIFRRSLYEHVGGYRKEFYFAQDLDLWTRLAEHGEHIVMPEVLYQAAISVGAISGRYRRKQVEITRFIVEAARLRSLDMSQEPALARARSIGPDHSHRQDDSERADAYYFIGACLEKNGDPRSTMYLRQAIALCPFHVKAWWRVLLG